MANNPRIDIGIRVDYKDVLEQMKSSFKKELTEISNHAKKTSFDADIEKKLKQIDDKVDSTFGNFEKKFDELSNQTIKTENFEKYQKKVSKMFDDVRSSISGAVGDIAKLRDEIKMLSGADFASSMKKQFEDLCQDVKKTHNELLQILDMAQSPSGDSAIVKQYSKTLDNIRKMKEEIKNINSQKNMGDGEAIEDQYFAELDNLDEYFNKYKELKKKLSALSKEDSGYGKLENDLINQEIIIKKSIATIKHLNGELEDIFGYSRLDDETLGKFKIASSFDKEIDSFAAKVEKAVSKSKEATEQIQGEFSTFKMKDGAIHIPIDIATSNKELKDKVKEIIDELKGYADNTPVIARVKLTLDKSSSKGYEKNSEVDKQQVEGQNEPAVDITKAIQKTYRDAAREAKQIVKTEIKKIQEEFENVPIKIKPDTDAFSKDLKKMINASFKEIAKETSGVKVNEELEKLVTNLKEVSSSLSGNENFKFGLDEASIGRITAAIRDMADMIQRAFGVASNDDIAAQWTTIESKFKGVAGEEGKLLKGNKEHKVAIQELAVEYKKYLDMGGKNDLSELTSHKQTVKNIATEYENLGKAAQEAAQKQEKVNKKPASTKVSSEEAEAIKGVTKQNKNLETQAGKTGTALDNEGKSAQSAAEKFRKLAKEKGAAVVANRELAKAAKETADALEREVKARKDSGTKTSKNAVDGSVYNENFSKWQTEIKQSLEDSGNYAEIYDAKISQASNGTVKFTAVVRDLDDNLKKLSANVNESGKISSPSISDLSDKQIAEFEKNLAIAEKIREAIAGMDDEGAEPIRLNREQLDQYVGDIQKVLQTLEESNKANYKLDLTSDGKLAIARKEISETGAETKTFIATIDNVDNILEKTSDGVKVSAEKIQEALADAFDSGKVSTATKDLATKAQQAFDVFKERAMRDSNFNEIESDLENLRQKIVSIGSQGDLNEFKQNLKDIGITLKNIGKDNKLGDILSGDRTFKNIDEVRANIDSLFASMGKVNEKSIRVDGTDKLTAEVKAANGEIRKMTVSLDSKGFARFVDNGIVEFGRLRSAAEGVFKGIQSMVRIYLSPQDFIRYFRQGFDAVKEIDTAMTELRKVSDASAGDISAYFDTAAASAKELGSSINEMIGATADWSRMGKSLPDSKELAEVAILYKNVGDNIDVEEATSSLVSTLQGFQMDAKDAIKIVDAFNEVIVRCPLISKCYI